MKRALEKAKLLVSEHKRRDHSGVLDTLKGHIKELNQLRQTDQRAINELRFELLSAQNSRRELETENELLSQKYEEEIRRLRMKKRNMKLSVRTHAFSHTTSANKGHTPKLCSIPCSPKLMPGSPRPKIIPTSPPRESSRSSVGKTSRSPKLDGSPLKNCLTPRLASPKFFSRRRSFTHTFAIPPSIAIPLGVPFPFQVQQYLCSPSGKKNKHRSSSPKSSGSHSSSLSNRLEVLVL